MNTIYEFTLIHSIAEVVDIHSLHTDSVEEVPEGQVEVACDHRVVVAGTEDIPGPLVVEDNSEVDTADVHNAGHFEVDGEYTPESFK